MTSNSKSIQVSVRIPRHLHENFNKLKDKELIKLTLTEALLRGVELTVSETLDKYYTPLDGMSVSEAKALADIVNNENNTKEE